MKGDPGRYAAPEPKPGTPGPRPGRKPVPISQDRGATISSLVKGRVEFRPPGPTCQSCRFLGPAVGIRFPDGTKRLKRECVLDERLTLPIVLRWTEPDFTCGSHSQGDSDV